LSFSYVATPKLVSIVDDDESVREGLRRLLSFHIANDLVREIHTRMPVILPEEHHQAWLSGEAGKEILVPYTGKK
jgi:hypothetical protein